MSRKIGQDDAELLQILQAELKKLQRQYRIMESDRYSYASEMKCFLYKQRKVIDALNKEKNNLTTKVSEDQQKVTSAWKKQFSNLTKKYENYLNQVQTKKDCIKGLNKDIEHLLEESRMKQYNKEMKTTQMDKNVSKFSKCIELLQDKLHNEIVKYDQILAENSELRLTVDSLLKNKVRFSEMYKKLVMKVNRGRKKYLHLIEQATSACEQKDEFDEKLRTILSKENQEITTHKQKMKELNRQLDHLIHLKEFIRVKGQKRILVDLEEKERQKQLKKTEETEQYINKYNSILANLKEFCQETNADKLSEIFLKQEEENFALFNYVNEVNNEIENLQAEINALESMLEEQKHSNLTTENERSQPMESLCNEYDVLRECNDKLETNLTGLRCIVETIFNETKTMFSILKNTKPSFVDLIGNDAVTAKNVHLYLDIIKMKLKNNN